MRRVALEPASDAVACGRHLMRRSTPMLDILMIAIAFGLFAAGIGYAYVCERL
jgi:hypothetical protein